MAKPVAAAPQAPEIIEEESSEVPATPSDVPVSLPEQNSENPDKTSEQSSSKHHRHVPTPPSGSFPSEPPLMSAEEFHKLPNAQSRSPKDGTTSPGIIYPNGISSSYSPARACLSENEADLLSYLDPEELEQAIVGGTLSFSSFFCFCVFRGISQAVETPVIVTRS